MRLALAAVLGWTVGTGPALAQPSERPALHWSRGPGAARCIDPQALALRVSTLTGHVLVEPTRADISIEGYVQALPRHEFEVHITASDRSGAPRGERSLRHAGDCRALDAAIAFVIAVMIDPDLALEQLPPAVVALGAEGPAPDGVLLAELEQRPGRPVNPAPVRDAHVETPPESLRVDSAARPHFALLAGASNGPRELPRTSLGLFAAVDYLPRTWLALELELRAMLMTSRVQLDSLRSVEALALNAALLGCPRYALVEALFVEGCVGVAGIVTRARGEGFERARTSLLKSYAGQLALGIGARLSERVALRARGFVRVAGNRPQVSYELGDGPRGDFVLPRMSGGLNLGASYAF